MVGQRLARLLPVAVLSLSAGACRAPEQRPMPPEEAVLARQNQGLEALIRIAEKGPLVRLDQVLVVVDQVLVQDLLSAAVPYERVVGDKYRIRIDAARVVFDDGFALVRLDGRAAMKGHALAEDASAEVSVYGGLDIVELDPVSGILRGRVKVMAVEARRTAVLGVKAPVGRLVEELGREKLAPFAALASSVEIPVRVDREVRIGGVGPEGGVRIEATTVPLHAAVVDVKALRGKLWISVGAGTEAR